MNLKQAMLGILDKNEIGLMSRSFDIIGDIAIVEIPRGLVKKEKLIAQKIKELHKNVKVVAKKKGAHEGAFRLQKIRILAGENRKETIHVESGIKLKMHVEKVYFSSRQATERLRIAVQVKKGEKVLVMFSGCGPYVFVISKNTLAKEVVGIEKNPVGHKYAFENIKLNKAVNVRLFKGDVNKVVPKLKQKFDHIIMPLPKEAPNYLPAAFKAAGKGCIIHLYDYLDELDIPRKAREKVLLACRKAKKRCRILNIVKCGQLGVRKYRVCTDFKIV